MKRLSPVTWLVVLAVVLIAAFVGSTILVERNASLLDERASDIADNAAPSITELAAARTEMRHLELGVGRYVGARIAGLPFDREQLDVWRAAVDEHLAAYARVPFFPDEREPYSRLAESKARVYGDLDRVLALVDNGKLGAARTRMLQTVQGHADEIDALIAQLININNTHAADARARDDGAAPAQPRARHPARRAQRGARRGAAVRRRARGAAVSARASSSSGGWPRRAPPSSTTSRRGSRTISRRRLASVVLGTSVAAEPTRRRRRRALAQIGSAPRASWAR